MNQVLLGKEARDRAPEHAMGLLGPVVYALLQHQRLLGEAAWLESSAGVVPSSAAWHGVVLTPRQLLLYLSAAAFDFGKRGERLRYDGICRWEHPSIQIGWMRWLENEASRDSMLHLLGTPLHEAQANAFRSVEETPKIRSPICALPSTDVSGDAARLAGSADVHCVRGFCCRRLH